MNGEIRMMDRFSRALLNSMIISFTKFQTHEEKKDPKVRKEDKKTKRPKERTDASISTIGNEQLLCT